MTGCNPEDFVSWMLDSVGVGLGLQFWNGMDVIILHSQTEMFARYPLVLCNNLQETLATTSLDT